MDLHIVCVDHLLKIKKECKTLREQVTPNVFTELVKACFQYNIACRDFKDLARRTASDKGLRDNASNIAKNLKYDGYQKGLASTVCEFFL